MKLFIFVLLKIVEILVIIFVPYWIGEATEKLWGCDPVRTGVNLWAQGLATIFLIIFVGFICFLIGWGNWFLAGKLNTFLKGDKL